MKCVICHHGELVDGHATVTLHSQGTTLVLQEVPALVCDNCGEEYLDESTTATLHAVVERAKADGSVLVVREYHAAA